MMSFIAGMNWDESGRSCHRILFKKKKTKWRLRRGIKMGPKKQVKTSKWQPLPESASTLQVMNVYGFDDHTVKPEDLTTEELEKCIKFVEQSNNTLEVENTVIEKYLLRVDPPTLLRIENVLEAATTALHRSHVGSAMNFNLGKTDQSDSSHGDKFDSFRSPSQSVQKSTVLLVGDKGPKVQTAHRIEIVNREIEELRNVLEDFRKKAKHSHYILRCRNEELTDRLREINESRDYFEEKLLVNHLDPLTGKLPGEKFIRYLEQKLSMEESEIDKIRMKTSTTRNQLKRVEQHLAQKAELGEILYAIDFEQLKIENQECQERLDEKIVHLLQAKKINGRCGTILSFSLKKLQEQLNRLGKLEKNIEMKEKMIQQLKLDEEKVGEEVQKLNKSVQKLRNLLNSYTVPDLFDYIINKSEMLDLKKEIKVCDRQLRLRDLALSSQSVKFKARIDQSLSFMRARSVRKIVRF